MGGRSDSENVWEASSSALVCLQSYGSIWEKNSDLPSTKYRHTFVNLSFPLSSQGEGCRHTVSSLMGLVSNKLK